MPKRDNAPLSLAARIKKIRSSLKLSQSAFAAALGASRKEVLGWERGDSSPPRDVAEKMVALPGNGPECHLDWLLGKNAEQPSRSAREGETTQEREEGGTLPSSDEKKGRLFAGIQKVSGEYGSQLKALTRIDEKNAAPLPFSSGRKGDAPKE